MISRREQPFQSLSTDILSRHRRFLQVTRRGAGEQLVSRPNSAVRAFGLSNRINRINRTTLVYMLLKLKSVGDDSSSAQELHFGWKLKQYAKTMRLHYANRGKRTARARLMEQM